MMKNFSFIILFTLISVFTVAQNKNREADLKAVFIYNFTRYIEWDSSDVSENFIIAVIGSSPVTASLNEIAKSYAANNKRIIVKVFDRPEDIGNCQVLFIPQKLPWSLSSILDRADKGILTVSEQEGYASRGTTFNFVPVNGKLKFEANLKSIASAGLKVSSQLLKLAIIIQ